MIGWNMLPPREQKGFSTIRNYAVALVAELGTSALAPGDVVNMWWIVFNDPGGCQAGIPNVSSCGPLDVMQGRRGGVVASSYGTDRR